jgi:hypothetical protein
MDKDRMKWLLRDKVVCDFRGFPIGRVKRIWFDDAEGPLVIVERRHDSGLTARWEAIPLRSIDTVRDEVRLKPPVFAE